MVSEKFKSLAKYVYAVSYFITELQQIKHFENYSCTHLETIEEDLKNYCLNLLTLEDEDQETLQKINHAVSVLHNNPKFIINREQDEEMKCVTYRINDPEWIKIHSDLSKKSLILSKKIYGDTYYSRQNKEVINAK